MCNALLNVRFKRKIFHRNWPRLFEWWWTLSAGLISIQWIAQFVLWTHIRWIAIYSLDSFIYLLNNWALMFWSGSFRFYCYCQEGKYSEKLVILKLLGILKELSKYLYTYLFVCLFVCFHEYRSILQQILWTWQAQPVEVGSLWSWLKIVQMHPRWGLLDRIDTTVWTILSTCTSDDIKNGLNNLVTQHQIKQSFEEGVQLIHCCNFISLFQMNVLKEILLLVMWTSWLI